MGKQQTIENSNNASDYYELLLKQNEGFDMRWCYQIKEVDRRLSYPIVRKFSLICDVGGAQGVDAFAFAEKGAFVIIVDINEYALRTGKSRAHKYGLDLALSFVKASATNLPFRAEIFDFITCFSTLDHLPNQKSAYVAVSEFSRVTRRQGYVAITVPNTLFFIGTVSMWMKNLAEPEAFFEQRFAPKELCYVMYKCGLIPSVFDSEFPKIAAPEILIFHFPKIFRKMHGSMMLLSFGTKVLSKLSKVKMAKLFGARMGYLSVKP
ncbi:MAG: class I SAM-dependent methyltransferase [Candidatus Jordarchaeaceae archaeon]